MPDVHFRALSRVENIDTLAKNGEASAVVFSTQHQMASDTSIRLLFVEQSAAFLSSHLPEMCPNRYFSGPYNFAPLYPPTHRQLRNGSSIIHFSPLFHRGEKFFPSEGGGGRGGRDSPRAFFDKKVIWVISSSFVFFFTTKAPLLLRKRGVGRKDKLKREKEF